MKKQYERAFREQRLTPDEVARDEEIRGKIEAEFPAVKSNDSASGRPSERARNLERKIEFRRKRL